MVELFSLGTAHHFQNALASQAQLRYRVFVENRGLPHEHFDGMEYDEFDTPAALYLVWRDEGRVVRGLIRLLPTTRPYMLQSYWPHLVDRGSPPASSDIWEITRVCVDKTFDSQNRPRILPELLAGVSEFFKMYGISAMVGVTRPHLVKRYIEDGIRWLGEPAEVEGETERAFIVPTTHIRPRRHCSRYGIGESVLRQPHDLPRVAA